MSGTVVVLVNGEVLANGQGSKISDQRLNAKALSESLYPLLASDLKLAVLHGNKPQVGFVLFRSELASHVLHGIPLDVCGADTQGATGYMLSQAFMNVFNQHKVQRPVMCILTQTLVDTSHVEDNIPSATIGPWFDRDKAEQYRQTRGWSMIEEPGRGYRRAVPSYPAKEILEFDAIQQVVQSGGIVIACGGGGIPVTRNEEGVISGIEAVIETEQIACLMARQLKANILLMVVENDNKFNLVGLSAEAARLLSIEELDNFLANETINSNSVRNKLRAASQFLHSGGEQVVITTLRGLLNTLTQQGGLRIGTGNPSVALFQINEQVMS
jgi:carbamate kinase